MPLPRLHLEPWTGAPPSARELPGTGAVLWLGRTDHPFTAGLFAELGDRAWSPRLRPVAVAGPPPGRNPWAHRQDRQQPLRWGPGDGLEGAPVLDAGDRGGLDGLVLVGICAGLTDQQLRALLRQITPLLRSEAPWLLVEPNGRSLKRIARSLRTPDAERGEGNTTVRSVEELRRLLETNGLGLEGAWAAPGSRRQRLARAVLGADVTADQLVVRGRRIR